MLSASRLVRHDLNTWSVGGYDQFVALPTPRTEIRLVCNSGVRAGTLRVFLLGVAWVLGSISLPRPIQWAPNSLNTYTAIKARERVRASRKGLRPVSGDDRSSNAVAVQKDQSDPLSTSFTRCLLPAGRISTQ